MIIHLPTKRNKATSNANSIQCFTYNMAAKNSWKEGNYVTITLLITILQK